MNPDKPSKARLHASRPARTDSWLLDDLPESTWILDGGEPHLSHPITIDKAHRPAPPSAIEDIFQLDYDREISFLVREGKISPGLVPKNIKR